MLTLPEGPYKEGFEAVLSAAACPYLLDSQAKEKASWMNGFIYASRTCRHCGARTAETHLRCYVGKNIIMGKHRDSIEVVYGILPDQCICERCFRQRSPPQEHTAYEVASVPQLLKHVLDQHAEAPFRHISFYALPHRRAREHYHCFTIVTNGDRYDIKNPHISESIEEMISLTQEAFIELTRPRG
jgi:hypothetical protein